MFAVAARGLHAGGVGPYEVDLEVHVAADEVEVGRRHARGQAAAEVDRELVGVVVEPTQPVPRSPPPSAYHLVGAGAADCFADGSVRSVR